MISCGSSTKPTPIPPPPATETPRPSPPPTTPAEPAKPASACDTDDTSFECGCEQGDTRACVMFAEVEVRHGAHDSGLARVFSLCQRDVADACFAAAKFMKQLRLANRHGSAAKDFLVKGETLLQTNCDTGNNDACLQLGRMLVQGKPLPANHERGHALVEKACTAKSVRACSFLGSMYATGTGVKKDLPRGTKLLDEACAGGASNGCSALADLVAKKDKKRAAALYAKACTGDDAEGCAKSGNVTKACELEHAESCVEAGAKETDPTKARTAFQRACDATIPAGCVGLAPFVANGTGGPRDWGAGVELAEAACKTKTPKACEVAKQLRASPPVVSCKTVEECTALCDEKIPAGCRAFAEVSLKQPDAECSDAEEGLEKACQYGDATSCLARGHIASRDDSVQWYTLGCAAKDTQACVYRDRAGTGDDKKRVAALQKACKARVANACVFYAEVSIFDRPKEAKKVLDAQCANGEARACRLFADVVENELPDGGIAALSGDGPSPVLLAQEKRAGEIRQRSCTLGDRIACELVKDADQQAEVEPRCMVEPAWMR